MRVRVCNPRTYDFCVRKQPTTDLFGAAAIDCWFLWLREVARGCCVDCGRGGRFRVLTSQARRSLLLATSPNTRTRSSSRYDTKTQNLLSKPKPAPFFPTTVLFVPSSLPHYGSSSPPAAFWKDTLTILSDGCRRCTCSTRRQISGNSE